MATGLIAVLVVGLVCVIAAIAGGGIKIANHEIGKIEDLGRQLVLGAFGIVVVGLALLLHYQSDGAEPQTVGAEQETSPEDRVPPLPNIDELLGPDGQQAEVDIRLDPASGTRGDEVQLSGRGFRPGEAVVVRIHTTQVGEFRADSRGELFREAIAIPTDAVCFSRQCTVHATGQSTSRWDDAIFELTD